MIIPIQREGTLSSSFTKKSPVVPSKPFETSISSDMDSWKNLSTLQIFNETTPRFWGREDIESFLVPKLGTRSLLKEKFDHFKFDNLNLPLTASMLQDHPIKIETFASESDKYVLTLNVKQFKPEELQVKITDDMISIIGKHEEKQNEQNFSCQEYVRKHSLPAGVKAEDIRCDISSDGVLKITAPKKVPQHLPIPHERTIPIQHSGLPAIRV